ncbi:MAG: hypothetical protein ACOCRK_00475 [bacterium]
MEILSEVMKIINNNIYISIYIYFIISFLLLEIIYLIYTNIQLKKITKNIKTNNQYNLKFLNIIIDRYNVLINNYKENVDTSVFIDDYIYDNKRVMLYFNKIISESDAIFLLFGLLGSFTILSLSFLSVNLEGINNFNQLFDRFQIVLTAVKPAFFVFIVGVLSSLIINLLYRLFNTEERIKRVKVELRNYLENNIKGQVSKHSHQLEAINRLRETIEDSMLKLEDIIKDSMIDSFDELENILKKNQNKDNQEMTDNNKINIVKNNK